MADKIDEAVGRLLREAAHVRYQGRLAGMAFRDRFELEAKTLERAAEIVGELRED